MRTRLFHAVVAVGAGLLQEGCSTPKHVDPPNRALPDAGTARPPPVRVEPFHPTATATLPDAAPRPKAPPLDVIKPPPNHMRIEVNRVEPVRIEDPPGR